MPINTQTILVDQHASISIRDRGLNYGDGFFTTAKIVNGQVAHWPLHKARLLECSDRLGFPPIDFTQLEQQITACIARQQLAVLKVLITRGSGGRGYGLPEQCNLTILLSVLEYPNNYTTLAKCGVSLNVSPIKLAAQPLLAGLKTLNRLEQVLIKRAMQAQQCDDVIVLDYQDNVIETSAANIFAIKQGQVFSPSIDTCGIQGVYLQSLCAKLEVNFKPLSVDELIQADAVFICNSLLGAIPVNRIEQHRFDVATSQRLLDKLLAKEAKC
jgi:4-amino-4-deoxychorismate lyase